MKTVIQLIILVSSITFIKAQSAPITIDGRFDDWVTPSIVTDSQDFINGADLLELQVSNDEAFLFIRIIIDRELNLKEDDPIAHGIYLDLDTDNDPTTGYSAQDGYGAELSINFSNRSAFFNINGGSIDRGFSDFQMRIGPTVTSNEFEIAISRNAIPDGIHALFSSSTIRILVRNSDNGDALPNAGEVFSYTFDETPVPALVPTEINKEDPNLIRMVAYNTLFDGLEDAEQVVHLGNIVKLLNPDIIGFSECNNTNASTVRSLMNAWLPLENGESWNILKNDDLITASRWPFIDYWTTLNRQFPALIDLPDDQYETDLLFTNSHLRCCTANSERQEQVDAYVAFMLDAKSPGGIITLPQNTPFVYAGDLNLVGYAQQLTTLLTGDIQGVQQFGPGDFLDWDDTELTDQICVQTDKRMAYTWRNDNSTFPPGRLDFFIFSDAVMSAEKAFTLQTATMPQDRLDQYNLSSTETRDASDHFPLTVDFHINQSVATSSLPIEVNAIFPNPVDDKLTISFAKQDVYHIILTDALGRIVLTKNIDDKETSLQLQNLIPGVYFLNITNENGGIYNERVLVE